MTQEAAIRAFWDDAAGAFDDEADHGLRAEPTREAWRRRLSEWMPAGPLDVLDAGCGTGSLSLLLAEAGHRVTGVDLAPRMVDLARAKLAAAGRLGRFLVGDAASPPTGDERFDVVLARHVVWTLPDPPAALRDWCGRLRPGGRLVLVEGRWAGAGESMPYAVEPARLPWDGGVRADELMAAVRPLAREVRVDVLSGEAALWGRPVADERYALVATVGLTGADGGR
ncbi:class I SAM-dependent methyltransferase [Jiangella alkaliphila]|uniref:Methyltransferase domain-containing protein n=1 Tax=Jiangella alkaliphila TaxID=419479 RepID=A0A1H2L2N7_9ACTN|nr:class I SAM-dependent methyltransferase [Jiangella alkaliphila]SDU75317.1 Methyltransferase domain-containing protein [Jiangella alkaliphila]